MKGFLKKILKYGIVLFVVLNAICFILLINLKKALIYKPLYVENTLKNKEFDYVILGDSRGIASINTNIIDSVTSKKGFNLSFYNSTLPSQRLMLTHFLSKSNSTKYCIMALSVEDLELPNESISYNDYRYLPLVYNDYVSTYFKEYDTGFKKHYMTKFLPLIGTSYYNKEILLASLYSIFNKEKRLKFDQKGNFTYPVHNNGLQIKHKEVEEYDLSQNKELQFLKKTCDANGIKLIMYIPPYLNKSVKIIGDDFKVLNHSDLLKDVNMFYDIYHVNKVGNEQASQAFINEMNFN